MDCLAVHKVAVLEQGAGSGPTPSPWTLDPEDGVSVLPRLERGARSAWGWGRREVDRADPSSAHLSICLRSGGRLWKSS